MRSLWRRGLLRSRRRSCGRRSAGRTIRSRGRSLRGRRIARELRVHRLQEILRVGQFLVELPDACLQIRDVIGQPLHLRAHRIQPRPEFACKSCTRFCSVAMLALYLFTVSLS